MDVNVLTTDILSYLHVRLLRFDACTYLTPYVMPAMKSGHQKTRVRPTGLTLTVNNKPGEEACGVCRAPGLHSFQRPHFLCPIGNRLKLFFTGNTSQIISLENPVLIPKCDIVTLIRPDSSWEDIFLKSALRWAWVRGQAQNPAGYVTAVSDRGEL